MLKHLVAGLVFAVSAASWGGGFTGTSDCGATVNIVPMNHGGANAALTREEYKNLEKGYGRELLLAEVQVDNSQGQDTFRFYTVCCHVAYGYSGSDRTPWINLRETAKASLAPAAAALFDDQKIEAGSSGRFVIGWDKKAVTSLTSFAGVALASDSGRVIVDCH